MSRADLLVCASFAEGYSTVCVEANMLGIPVLSTCVDGAKEIVDDAGAGMVVGMDDDSLCGRFSGSRSWWRNGKRPLKPPGRCSPTGTGLRSWTSWIFNAIRKGKTP